MDTRLKQRTNIYGKRTRKDPSLGYKSSVRMEWERLKTSITTPITPKIQKHLLTQLRAFAYEKDPGKIIHHVDQVERWPLQSNRGTGSRHRSSRKSDPRRLSYLDNLLVGYIRGRRATNAVVSRAELLTEANKFLKDEAVRSKCAGKACVKEGYVQKMMQRNSFKVKAVKKRTELTNEQVKERAQKFHTMIFRCLKHVTAVLNFDEVPGSLAGVMGKLKTVAETSDIDVKVYVNPSAFKRCCTVIAIGCVVRAVDDDDDEVSWRQISVKPIVLLKGEPTSAAMLNEVYDPRVIVTWTKKGVITAECMLKIVIPSIREQLSTAGVERCLTILDCATSHLSVPVVNACWAAKMPTAVVPANATSWLQWVDTHFAACYRVYHRDAFLPYATTKMTASQKRRLLVRIVADAHAWACRNVVDNFVTLGYTNPETATVRGVPGYRFEPPPDVDDAADSAKMQQRIDAAVAQHEAARPEAPANRPPAKKLGRPAEKDKPVVGYADIRQWFRKKPPGPPAAASSGPQLPPNHFLPPPPPTQQE